MTRKVLIALGLACAAAAALLALPAINEALNGIDNVAGSSGGDFTGNHFVNVETEVLGAGPAPTAKRLAAVAARAASPAQP